MSLIQALILGVVQGITEFLPVSSSGHLAILQNIFKLNTNYSVFFNAMVHLGTLAAIFAAFKKDIKKILLEACRCVYDIRENVKTAFYNRKEQEAKRYKIIISNNYRKLFLLLLVSTVPTIVEGLLFQNLVAMAGSNLLAPAMGLLITAVVLVVADFIPAGEKIPKDVSVGTAFGIGICQGITVFPGISRCGITIAVCLMCGFNRKFSVKYTFLLAIPTILGAAVLELASLPGSGITAVEIAYCLAAAAAAGIVGYFCIKKMLSIIQKKQFRFFAVYCFIIGAAAAAYSFAV